MLRSNRLAVRLVRWLAIAQIGSVILGMAAWMLLSPYVTFRDVAADRARTLVAASIVGTGAELRIAPEADLESYAETRPGFQYAAMLDGRIAAGSSPELAGYLRAIGDAVPTKGRLEAPRRLGPGPIIFEARDTDGKRLVIATTGNRFGIEDLQSLLTVYLRSVLAIFTPAVLSALLVVPLVVHRALRPLRRAGREAEAIGFETLDRRLSLEGLTKEVSPFVAAINALLERLAAGAARQRRFAADAAHELRTPVAILRARLSTLPAFDGKKELERDARRISMLVDQLLSAARLSRADMKPTVPVRLDRIARDVVGNCAPLALNTGRDIAFLGSNKPVQIIGDEEALTSAITNLVDNAIRAEPKGGTVEVATGLGEGGREGWVEVRDHGRGVPEADRDNLFEPFWRNGDTGSGTGLGLAIVREIASAHEGMASMRPGPDGRGAVFRLEFPAC